ncbi:MAG: glyoxalase superfamily protein [Bacteroidota bacterium]|nr:glyoxalase superfamily protein [Bacteroidota bacterium]
MTVEKVIPILRIFDYKKAIEFYIDWLGFKIEWEHVFEEGMPKYIEITRDGITIHLSEHHGDTTPATRVFLWCTGLKEYHKILIDKKYKNNRPGLSETFYGSNEVQVIDPFGNRLSFNEKIAEHNIHA